MKKRIVTILLASLFAVGTINAFAEEAVSVEVETTHGTVMGGLEDGVDIFRGIPYGGDTKGENRFLPAQPAEDWEGVLDCTVNGPVAWQDGNGSLSGNEVLGHYFSGQYEGKMGVEDEVKDENCLVLDVVTPATDDAKRPVIVYMHGGGYATGSGTLVIGSRDMVKEQDIVMVGVNMRLNVFGYLYLGGFDEKYAQSGMAGVTDMIEALRWVQDNIEKFGGDPSNVTIMGESGGGGKVNHLMAIPEAKGLFQKAIIESGMALSAYPQEDATAAAQQVLDNLGISSDNLEALYDVAPEDLLAASMGVNLAPVADGELLPVFEGTDFAPEVSRDIPLMIGSSADEMAVFADLDYLATLTWDNLAENLVASGIPEDSVDAIIDAYKAYHGDDDVTPAHLYENITSTQGALGSNAFYQAMARAEMEDAAPVYLYVVEYDSILPGDESLRFAWHTADLPLQMRVVWYPDSEEMSKIMSAKIAAFARTGDPSTEDQEWPAFTTDEKLTMVYDDETRVESDPWAALREAAN